MLRENRRIPIALLCGAAVFALLNITAWYNLRGEQNVCRRQGHTRLTLRILQQDIEAYRKEHKALPQVLNDVPDLQGFSDDPIGPSADEWGNQVQYRLTASSFDLYSFGRDGKPGGVGLDADIYHDRRNSELSLATFSQYFGETDISEVDRGSFFWAGVVAGIMVAFITFRSLNNLDKTEKKQKLVYYVVYALAIVFIASLVGTLLLPLHIPSGH